MKHPIKAQFSFSQAFSKLILGIFLLASSCRQDDMENTGFIKSISGQYSSHKFYSGSGAWNYSNIDTPDKIKKLSEELPKLIYINGDKFSLQPGSVKSKFSYENSSSNPPVSFLIIIDSKSTYVQYFIGGSQQL